MNKLRKLLNNTAFPITVLFVLFLVLNRFISPTMFTGSFITSFFKTNFPMMCVALATGIVILGGDMDVSLGAVLSLVNVVLTKLVMVGVSWQVAVILGILVGIAAGAFNGLLIAYLRVPPMVATYASMSVFTGIGLWVLPMPGGKFPKAFRALYKIKFGEIPISALISIVLLVATIILMKSPLGIRILSVGHNVQKSFVSGINVYRVQFLTYVIAGFITSIGAIAITASVGGGDNSIGNAFSMTAIAACVIGGISLSGGEGNTVGAYLGIFFLAILTTTVVSANVPSYYQDLLKGLIMLAGLILASFISMYRKNRLIAEDNTGGGGQDE